MSAEQLHFLNPHWPIPFDAVKMPASHQVVVQSAFARCHSSLLVDVSPVVVKPVQLPNLARPGHYAMCRTCYHFVKSEELLLSGLTVEDIAGLSSVDVQHFHAETDRTPTSPSATSTSAELTLSDLVCNIFVSATPRAMADHLVTKHKEEKQLPQHVLQAATTILKLYSPGITVQTPRWNIASPTVRPLGAGDSEDLLEVLDGKVFESFAEADVYLLTVVGTDGTTLYRASTDPQEDRKSPIGAIYSCKNRPSNEDRTCRFGIALQSQFEASGERRPPYDMTIRRDEHTCRLKSNAVKEEAKEDSAANDNTRNAEAIGHDERTGKGTKRRRFQQSIEEPSDSEVEVVARQVSAPARGTPDAKPAVDGAAASTGLPLRSLGLTEDIVQFLAHADLKTTEDLTKAGLPKGQTLHLLQAVRAYLRSMPEPWQEQARQETRALIAVTALEGAFSQKRGPGAEPVAIQSITGLPEEVRRFLILAGMRTIENLRKAEMPFGQARNFLDGVEAALRAHPNATAEAASMEVNLVISAIRIDLAR